MATLDVINPATAETIDSVPNTSADEVDEGGASAREQRLQGMGPATRARPA